MVARETGAVVGGADAEAGLTIPNSRWWAVLLIALGTFTLVTLEFLPVGLLGPISTSLGVSVGTAGLLVTVPGLVAAVASPVFAVSASRLPRSALIAWLTLAMTLSAIVMALAERFAVAMLSRVLLGLAVGGVWTFAAPTAAKLVSAGRTGTAIAMVAAGISTGTVLGAPVGTIIGQTCGWHVAFGGTSLLAAVVMVLQGAFLPTLPRQNGISWKQLFALPRVSAAREALIVAGLLAAAHFMAYTFMQPMLQSEVGLGDAAFTNVFAAYGVAGLAGVALAERLASRNPIATSVAAVVLLAISLAGMVVAHSDAGLVVGLTLVWGLSFGAIPVSLQVWLQRAAPTRFEAGSSLMVSVFQIFLALGAAMGGVFTQLNGVSLAFLMGATLACVCAMYVLVPRAFYHLKHKPQ